MRKVKDWNRADLSLLYSVEGKTLQEIGDMYGVTRERIRQVMAKFKLPRITKRSNPHPGETRRYKSFQDYINGQSIRNKDYSQTLSRFYDKLFCAECGKTHNLHLHHINYPVMKRDDIQILCRSCHKIKHSGKMPYGKQLDLYHSYQAGQSVKALIKNYDITINLAYKIIHKIGEGLPALKR